MVVIYLLVSNFIKVIISEADYFEDMCKELEVLGEVKLPQFTIGEQST